MGAGGSSEDMGIVRACPLWGLADGQLICAQWSTQLLWQLLFPMTEDEWFKITLQAPRDYFQHIREMDITFKF